MHENTKSKLSNYIVGGLCGAVIVLVAGFSLGMIKTNGAVSEAVDLAIVAQQASFCAERGRAAFDYVDSETFAALATSEQRDFVAQFSEFEGQSTTSGRAVANACRSLLEAA